MSAKWPWSELNMDGPAEIKDIKRAFARKLKSIDQNDPAVFQALNMARDRALAIAKRTHTQNDPARPSMVQAALSQSDISTENNTIPARMPRPDLEISEDISSDPPREIIGDRTENNTTLAKKPLPDLEISEESAPDPTDEAAPDTDVIQEPLDMPTTEMDTVPEPPLEQPDNRQPIRMPERTYAKADVQQHDTAAFWQDFNECINWPLPHDRLTALLQSPAGRLPDVRNHAENRLCDLMFEKLSHQAHPPLSYLDADFMEEHFAWLSDGTRFARRFRSDEAFEVLYTLIREKALSQGSDSVKPAHLKRSKENTQTLYFSYSIVIVTSLIGWVFRYYHEYQPLSVEVQLTIAYAGVMLGGAWVLKVLGRIVGALATGLRLDRIIKRALSVPNRIPIRNWLWDKQKHRVLYTLIAALLVLSYMIWARVNL